MSDIRRVVTGLDAEDRAVVQFDRQLAVGDVPYSVTTEQLQLRAFVSLGYVVASRFQAVADALARDVAHRSGRRLQAEKG